MGPTLETKVPKDRWDTWVGPTTDPSTEVGDLVPALWATMVHSTEETVPWETTSAHEVQAMAITCREVATGILDLEITNNIDRLLSWKLPRLHSWIVHFTLEEI